DPDLQLIVLRYIPIIAGVYLCRVAKRKPQPGFEAVLLALYAHETTSRNGQAVTMNVPDLSHPSLYHETKTTTKNNSTCLNLAIVSPSLEPHGTVRSTRRARIVGVALELYFSRISHMPASSKLEFCEFCVIWSGKIEPENKKVEQAEDDKDEDQCKAATEFGRIHLPWELVQPILRILGHCLVGPERNKELCEASMRAARSLYLRALHDIDAKGILATESLLKLGKMSIDGDYEQVDHTEIPKSNVISL
uniref:Hyccin n=1 Tax=Kalanchoe fedtschenkoi TaxID=63787 RepID=A0A7N0VIW4_KALFE